MIRKRILMTCVLLFAVYAAGASLGIAQHSRTLVGQTWVLTYTTGRVNSKDYSEYAKITFEKSGKVLFDNGETGHWRLAGNKLTVENDKSETVLVHSIEVKLGSTSGAGTGILGMTATVPYWVRLTKRR